MILKERIRTADGPRTRVTFVLPEQLWADSVHLVGDFNGWSRSSHPFARDREGRWLTTVDLAERRTYRFRYLVNHTEWLVDGQAAGWPATGDVTAFVVHTLGAAEGEAERTRARAAERVARPALPSRGRSRPAPVPVSSR